MSCLNFLIPSNLCHKSNSWHYKTQKSYKTIAPLIATTIKTLLHPLNFLRTIQNKSAMFTTYISVHFIIWHHFRIRGFSPRPILFYFGRSINYIPELFIGGKAHIRSRNDLFKSTWVVFASIIKTLKKGLFSQQ